MLSKLSVKKPYTVLVCSLLVIILGVVSFMEMTPDLLPSIELPYAVVATAYPGASPEEVELSVTKPIEQALATLNNVENISSTSMENMSMVILEFSEETNMDAMGVDIREKLDMISGYFAASAGSPVIMKLNPDMMPVMVAAVDVDNKNHIQVSSYVEKQVIPLLESTEGVASVSADGLVEKQIQVVINQEKIDKINEKLYDSVDSKMNEAQEKLSHAKAEVEEGKEALSEKNKEFTAGMYEASAALTKARLELLKSEIEMAAGEAQLKEKEEELKATKKELADRKNQLNASEEALSEQFLQAQEEYLALGKIELPPEGEELERIRQRMRELEAAIVVMDEGKKVLAQTREELEKAEKQIEEGEKALLTAKKEFEQGKAALTKGKSTLDSKEAQLNSQKAQAEGELNRASSQLLNGEKELDSQIENFKSTKKEALKEANVDDKITADMISKILQAENFSMPAGYVNEEGIDYLVRVGEKFQDADELNKLVLFDLDIEGMEPVTLLDVADVSWTDNGDETYAKINGNEGIILSFQKQTSYATAVVSQNIQEKFKAIGNGEEGVHFTPLMDQGIYINMVIDSVLNNLLFGAVLAVLILILFLKDLKPTIIIACSIPLSVVFAIVLMYFSGITLNIISLSGLAVGVGMLVDNSVVVIENIYRLRNMGVSPIKAAVTGAVKVSGAIMASTLTTVCVFLPIVFVKGISRELFTDMALTIGYSLLASLIAALTLVPSMSAGMLKTTKIKEHKVFDRFVRLYEIVVRKALQAKWAVLLLAVMLLAGSIAGAYKNGTAFMPDMDSTQISVSLEMPEGSLLSDTIKMSDKAVERIEKIEDVETVGAKLSGGSQSILGSMGGNESKTSVSMYVLLREDKKNTSQDIAKAIQNELGDLDCEITASGSNMDMSALGGSGISIEISGPEIDTLKELAYETAAILKKAEGTEDVFNGIEDPAGEIKITVDKDKAMLKGLTVAQVYGEIKAAIAGGDKATELSLEGSQYEIVVKEKNREEMTREDIRNYVFHVTGADGKEKKVKLKNIAEIEEDISLSSISRNAQQRYIKVTSGLKEGYNIGNVSRDVQKAVNKLKVPAGYKLTFTGEDETINEAMGQMVKMLLLAVVFIYFIMVAQFQSLLSPFIVMFTIPLAFTGGFLGLLLTGMELSVIAVLGFVMLSGIVVNNGIVLVDYINQLRQEGVDKKEAIVEAGMTRMRPILMTALTTILGLSTMALGVGMGSDLMQPIAIVTIGGLLYATITTLFVIPVLYDLFNRREMKVISEEELMLYEE